MKVKTTNAKGESREQLLREYFLNASLLAALNRVRQEALKLRKKREEHLDLTVPPM